MNFVVSVNLGLPRDIEWQGKVVHTGIWKRPVAGRVMARRLNLDGDGQGDLGGHGGEQRAVMVYQLESYRYWQAQLGRTDFQYGQFGENLTVDGLADHEVCIGDRYRIGSALFEVTQPRVTCYRVGMRMNHAQMPSLLVAHKRPGFYFRVIEEGDIAAGDEIIQVLDGPEHLTVAEADGLLYLPGHAREQLERALRVPALSRGWKSSFASLLAARQNEEPGNAGLAPASPAPAWLGFRTLRVAAVHQESTGVRSFTLQSEDGTALPPPQAGQFLVFKLGLSEPTLRSYSMSGAPGTGTYRISVKRAEGAGSRFFHDQLQVGGKLQVSAPRGNFLLVSSELPVVLLSAGIGATPVLAMLYALAASGSRREVWWCYGTRNGKEHPFAEQVKQLLASLPRAHSWIAYSQPATEDQQGVHYDTAGHLTLAALQQIHLPQEAEFYLCGPAAFLTKLTAELSSWGVTRARIHSETFGTESALTPGIASAPAKTPHLPAGDPGLGPKVSFTRSGVSAPWDPKYQTLLEFAEACDVPVRWACRAGVCHTCESGLIEGQVAYAPLPLEVPAGGSVLICCSSPLTALELDL